MSKNNNSPEVLIDGKFYSLKRLKTIIDFYDAHQIKAGQTSCPLCGSEYSENELFVCDECGSLLSTEEKCREHDHGSLSLCKDCCSNCSANRAYEDAVNREIDITRGK